MHNTIIEIDKKQFISNLKIIRNYLNKTNENGKFCLPVKANGYGHGMIEISKLAQPFVDYLAVACLDEGISLRKNGIIKPILVFGTFTDDQINHLIEYNLEITISSFYKAELVNQFCIKNKVNCKIHLKIDTGMNRVGIRVENAKKLIDYVLSNPKFQLMGVYSHLACSDDPSNHFTDWQIKSFTEISTYVKILSPNTLCHLANSGGVCYFQNAYFDMVRPGILTYGYFTLPNSIPNELKDIKPCLSLKSKVTYFKVVKQAQGISYNHTYKTSALTRTITIPIGYGDGYRRSLSNIGHVLVRGKKYPISGLVCMDMLMVDIGPTGEAYIDDEVILIGCQGQESITLAEIAIQCNTIIYEILCGFNIRISRVYI